jgi:hypothetical protein
MATTVQNPPDARFLMEAARSFGNYDLASAIADLVDNSITASAGEISISCFWNNGTPEVRIRDDGDGMDRDTLIRAMRPAGTDPNSPRAPHDLGRFGLGLKTASLSQCRCMTVVAVADGEWCAARWDLDQMDDWSMDLLTQDEIDAVTELPGNTTSGTEVIWSKLDRLTESGTLGSDAFNALIDHARVRLALTFHRFISPDVGQRALKLKLNGTLVRPFDPFHEKHLATQPLSPETIPIRDGQEIVITPFILPHFSKMSSDEYESLAGEEGYLRNQGFYVYRNRRLIIHGTWFRLVRHGDLSKLARVRIDIPNSLDTEWKITVDKAGAQIPSVLRTRLRTLIDRIRDYSGDVYRSRGARLVTQGVVSVWNRQAANGAITYRISRSHPIIDQFVKRLSKADARELEDILGTVESSFPIDTLFADAGDSPKSISLAVTDPGEARGVTRRFIEKFMKNVGDRAALVSILSGTEPFRSNGKIVEEELQKAGINNG